MSFRYNTCEIVATNDLEAIGGDNHSKQTTSESIDPETFAGLVREAGANKRNECGIVREVHARRRLSAKELLVMDGPLPQWAIGKLVGIPYTGYHFRLGDAQDSRVYFVESPSTGRVKIGLGKDPEGRLKIFKVGCPIGDLKLSVTIRGNRLIEQELHHVFRQYRLHREWFECGPELRGCIDSLVEARATLPAGLVRANEIYLVNSRRGV